MTAKCLRCGRVRIIRARRCCGPCYVVAGRQGGLDEYPVTVRPLPEIVADYKVLAWRGGTDEQHAAALGYRNLKTFRHMLRDARKRGLLR